MTYASKDRRHSSRGTWGNRWFQLALGVSVVVRVAAFWLVSQHPERALTPDSALYLDLGRHFAQAYVNSDAEYLQGSVLRTPGYPLFCYLWFRLLGDSVTSILVAQNIVSLICTWIVFVLAQRLVGRPAATWAAVLVSMDPLALTYSNLIRNEVLFTVGLALAVLQWHRSLSQHRAHALALTGFLFGIVTLIRPITSYLMLFVIPADLWLRHRRRASVMVSAWMLAGFITPVGGWIARNHHLVGQSTVSSIADYNLLHYRVAGAIADETGEQRSIVARRLSSSDSSQPDSLTFGEPSSMGAADMLRLLADHPYGTVMSTARGSVRMLFGPGTANLNQMFYGQTSTPGLLVFSLLVGYLIILYSGLVVGITTLTRRRCAEPLVLLGAIVLYTVLISSGPEAYSRFRAPLIPLFAIVSGVGFATVVDRFQSLRPAR